MDSAPEAFASPHRPTGWFGLVMMALMLVATFSDGAGMGHLAFASAILLFSAVIVVTFFRPAVLVRDDHLLVRNSLSDIPVPWQAIRAIAVRYVMEVDVGDRVVRAVAFGRTPRQMQRQRDRSAGEGADVDYTEYVVGRLRELADARGGLRHSGAGDASPVPSWRWPEIAVLVALAVLTVVLTVLA